MGPLAHRVPPDILPPLIDKLSNLQPSSSDVSGNMRDTALRSLVAALPQPQPGGAPAHDAQISYNAISKVLVPRLIGRLVLPGQKAQQKVPKGMLEIDENKGYSADAVDLLIEVVRCFGSMLQAPELAGLSESVMAIIENPSAGSVVKKRALAAIGIISVYFDEGQLSHFVSQLIEGFRNVHLTVVHRKYLIATIGALTKSTPTKFGPYIKTLAPFVLSVVGKEEFEETEGDSDDSREPDTEVDELRETALIAVEALIGSCGTEMQSFTNEVTESALRYLKYDPNVASVADDEEMGGTQDSGSDDGVTSATEEDDDDEFADLDDSGESDADDVSWKVRRCASKLLYTAVTGSLGIDNTTMFGQIAPALIGRITREREENVKIEVLATLSGLIRKNTDTTNLGASVSSLDSSLSGSRKRRRQDSDAGLEYLEFGSTLLSKPSPPIVPVSPAPGPQADMAMLIPKIIQAVTVLWKKATVSLKQSAVVLLKFLALSRNGALSRHLQQIEDPIADALKISSISSAAPATSTSSTTTATLQLEALALVSAVTETNPANSLLPFLMALIPAVASTVKGKNFKVSGEALTTIEQMIKALTPPRLPSTDQDHAMQLNKLCEVIVEKVSDNNADLEVRHKAIQVFGVLLARTSSTQLLPADKRTGGLSIISERLKNETTRLPSARAIATIAVFVKSQNDVPAPWLRQVALELGAQLRKADRALRGSSLDALRGLSMNPVTAMLFDQKTIQELSTMLLPLLTTNDFHLLTPALIILAKIIPFDAKKLVNDGIVEAFSGVVTANITGAPLQAFLLVVRVIGEQGVGAPLMKKLLAVGVSGDSTVVGRAIGTLTVFGESSVGVGVKEFQSELVNAEDAPRKCLALSILGEIGFRMGPSSPLSPETFTKSMSADSDKVRLTAAVALGSAGASNIKVYLPVILKGLGQSTANDYLLLHSLREILQHPDKVSQDVAPFANELWQKIFTTASAEDNRAVGAECIGRLSLIEPATYIPQLQSYVQDPKALVRGTVITAFRYTLADTSESYTTLLKSIIVPTLTSMLADNDIGNRRLAISTLNSAIHNKHTLILPELNRFLPTVMTDSHIKPELIRVVSYGPFKMDVDDGLDLRKVPHPLFFSITVTDFILQTCYETFYAFLELPSATSLPLSSIADRLVAGVTDDHDIRTLSNLLLIRLSAISPDEIRRRLSSLADQFKSVLLIKPKETAVKQEIEKLQDASNVVVRTTLELEGRFGNGGDSAETMGWKQYLEWLRREFGTLVIQNEQAMR